MPTLLPMEMLDTYGKYDKHDKSYDKSDKGDVSHH